MSIFKDSAIVLKITKQEKANFVYHLMSEKFWKIVAVKKLNSKEKSIDIWYHINYEIDSVWNSKINKLKMIKIINEFHYEWKKFKEINEFLNLINIILKKIGLWIENIAINEVVKDILKYNKDDLEIKLILAQIKVINLLWELDINNKDKTIAKILSFINKNKFQDILKLSWITQGQKKELQNVL
jgi:hypothetical protein